MIKKIHIIMLGGKPTWSNIEMANIKSFKKLYPDFELKIWKDADCLEWIKESPFASHHYYKTKVLAYVADYLRCRILYEEGGLYVDTDVFAVNRIPDSYFEKSFTAWDIWGGPATNNGTCFYACEPKLPLFKEFCDVMANSELDVPVVNGAAAAMMRIDRVLRKHGMNTNTEGFCETDQDLGDIVIRNRSQFGARHGDGDGYLTHGKTIYLTHACSGSWVVPSFHKFVNVKYAIVDKNTDVKILEDRIERFSKKRNGTQVLLLLLADEFTCSENLMRITDSVKGWFRTYILPIGGNKRGNAMDYIMHRVADVHSCRDIMREDYCG